MTGTLPHAPSPTSGATDPELEVVNMIAGKLRTRGFAAADLLAAQCVRESVEWAYNTVSMAFHEALQDARDVLDHNARIREAFAAVNRHPNKIGIERAPPESAKAGILEVSDPSLMSHNICYV
jgi:hypothetical protein